MEEIYFGFYNSPIGLIQIETTKTHLVSIEIVEETKEAEKSKETAEKPEILKKVIKELEEYFLGKRKKFSLDYMLDGTEFQKKVWKALTEIPYGETVSYKDIALKIGNEKASRAVGNANNKNKICIIIPCHRVLVSNKALVGYAYGIDKKKWLLEHENKFK